jgi:hypothetical protein
MMDRLIIHGATEHFERETMTSGEVSEKVGKVLNSPEYSKTFKELQM